MNRIVLIGNGFDLSLGLKTGYKDFICWLLKKGMFESLESEPEILKCSKRSIHGCYENRLFKVYLETKNSSINYQNKIESLTDFYSIRVTT